MLSVLHYPASAMGLPGSWLHHGEEVAGVTSLVAESDRHDHLPVASDDGLVVLFLNPHLSSVEDGAVGMRKVPLALSLALPSALLSRLRLGIARRSTLPGGLGVCWPDA